MTKEEKKAIKYFKALDKLTFEPYLSILLNLLDKQHKEIESNKQMIDELNFRYNIEHSKNLSKKELINEQQKEIEELRKENFDTVYIQAIENYKDKIRDKIKEITEYYEKEVKPEMYHWGDFSAEEHFADIIARYNELLEE